MSLSENLKPIRDELDEGKITAVAVDVRDVLAWAGAKRRGYYKVLQIRSGISKAGLVAVPDIDNVWIDGTVDFQLKKKASVKAKTSKIEPESAAEAPIITIDDVALPSNTIIGSFPPANAAPLSIKPGTQLDEIITHLMAHDYSQLPVMTSDRTVKGMVSWRSIGSRLALKLQCDTANDCMTVAHIVNWNDSMFDAIGQIERYDAVLVRNSSNQISGIVTAADFSLEFKSKSEPFLLLGEIETLLREMIAPKFNKAELEAAKFGEDDSRKIETADDLNFGEYIALLEEPERWKRLKLHFDRAAFISKLNRIREIRNEVMHFGPDPLDEGDLVMLRTFSLLLGNLKAMNLIGSNS